MLLLKLLLILRLISMANFLKTASALRKIGANNRRENWRQNQRTSAAESATKSATKSTAESAAKSAFLGWLARMKRSRIRSRKFLLELFSTMISLQYGTGRASGIGVASAEGSRHETPVA